MIKELTTYIEDNTDFVIDTDLFAGFRPATAPDDCVAILEPTGGEVNSYFPDAGEKVVQVLSRAKSYWDARANAYTVFDLLKSKAQVTFPVVTVGKTYKAEFIQAIHFPQNLGPDEKGLWEISTNFIIRIREV